MSRNSTAGAWASSWRSVVMPAPVCATISSSGQSEPSSSASSSRSSGSSSAMMARGLGTRRYVRMPGSKRLLGGAIPACHGLVLQQILPCSGDDDALGLLLRQQLPLGALVHRAVSLEQGGAVHADRHA